jgi:hypothetical protein
MRLKNGYKNSMGCMPLPQGQNSTGTPPFSQLISLPKYTLFDACFFLSNPIKTYLQSADLPTILQTATPPAQKMRQHYAL